MLCFINAKLSLFMTIIFWFGRRISPALKNPAKAYVSLGILATISPTNRTIITHWVTILRYILKRKPILIFLYKDDVLNSVVLNRLVRGSA